MLRYGTCPLTPFYAGGFADRACRIQIATLPTQYGLYSAFVGVLIYCVSTLELARAASL